LLILSDAHGRTKRGDNMPIVVYSHKEGGYGDLMFALKTVASLKKDLKRNDIFLVVSEEDQNQIRQLQGDKEFKVDVLNEAEFKQKREIGEISSIDCIIEGPVALKDGGAVGQGRLGDVPKNTPIFICSEYSCDYAGKTRLEGTKLILETKNYHYVKTLYTGPGSNEEGVWIDETLLSESQEIKNGNSKTMEMYWDALGELSKHIRGEQDIKTYNNNTELALQYSANPESIEDFLNVHYALTDPSSPKYQDIVCIIPKEKADAFKRQLNNDIDKLKEKLKKDSFTKIIQINLADPKKDPPEKDKVIPLIEQKAGEMPADKIYRVILVNHLNRSQMRAMLLLSKGVVGVTGDQSVIEAICARQVPIYETRKHKVNLANNIYFSIAGIAKNKAHLNAQGLAHLLYQHDPNKDYPSDSGFMITKKDKVDDLLTQLHEKKLIRKNALDELHADLSTFAEEQRMKLPTKMQNIISDGIKRKDLKIEIPDPSSPLSLSPLSPSSSPKTLSLRSSPITLSSRYSSITLSSQYSPMISARSSSTPLSSPFPLFSPSLCSVARSPKQVSYPFSRNIGKITPKGAAISLSKTINEITPEDIKLYQLLLAEQKEQKNMIKVRRKDKTLQDAKLPSIVSFPPDEGFFILSDTIGKGGWGRVKKAYYYHPERGIQKDGPVAIKIEINKAPEKTKKEFNYFLRAHQTIKNQHIQYQSSQINPKKSNVAQKSYSLMPYLPGMRLDQFLKEKKEMSLNDRLKMAASTMKALSELHDKNIVHLDIKPENMIYDEKNNAMHIVDFGCAEEKETEIKFVAPKLGNGKFNEEYTPPEFGKKFNGPSIASPAMDIYSSAIVIAQIMGISIETLIRPKLQQAEINQSEFSECYDSVEGIRRLERFMASNDYDFKPVQKTDDNLYRLLLAMTDQTPEKRPHAHQIHQSLEKALSIRSDAQNDAENPPTMPLKKEG
jgi:tRNA A-37 threonylcarbamoyl transferase component Bud32